MKALLFCIMALVTISSCHKKEDPKPTIVHDFRDQIIGSYPSSLVRFYKMDDSTLESEITASFKILKSGTNAMTIDVYDLSDNTILFHASDFKPIGTVGYSFNVPRQLINGDLIEGSKNYEIASEYFDGLFALEKPVKLTPSRRSKLTPQK